MTKSTIACTERPKFGDVVHLHGHQVKFNLLITGFIDGKQYEMTTDCKDHTGSVNYATVWEDFEIGLGVLQIIDKACDIHWYEVTFHHDGEPEDDFWGWSLKRLNATDKTVSMLMSVKQ